MYNTVATEEGVCTASQECVLARAGKCNGDNFSKCAISSEEGECRFLLICRFRGQGCGKLTAKTCEEAKRREVEAKGSCPLLAGYNFTYDKCDIPCLRELLPDGYSCHKGKECIPRTNPGMGDMIEILLNCRAKDAAPPSPAEVLKAAVFT